MDVFLKHGFKVDRVTFKAFHIMKQTVDAPFGLFYTNDINSSPYVVKIYDFSHEQSLLKLASRYDIDETAMVPQNKGKINVKIVAKFKEYYDVSDEMVKFVNISPKYDMRNWYKDHMIELEKKKLPAQTDFEDRPTLVAPVEYDRIPPSTSRCYDGDDLRTPKRAKQTMVNTIYKHFIVYYWILIRLSFRKKPKRLLQ